MGNVITHDYNLPLYIPLIGQLALCLNIKCHGLVLWGVAHQRTLARTERGTGLREKVRTVWTEWSDGVEDSTDTERLATDLVQRF